MREMNYIVTFHRVIIIDNHKRQSEMTDAFFGTWFRSYEPGAEVVLGKAYPAQENFKEAEEYAKSAYDKADFISD